MGTLKLSYTVQTASDGTEISSLPRSEFDSFNESILSLGDLSSEAEPLEALAAIFDLEGFTSFSSQNDPHLVMPEYLSRFLKWIFAEVANVFTHKSATGDLSLPPDENTVHLWAELPFFAKFLGDGILFLWETTRSEPIDIGNIVLCLQAICDKYGTEFLPSIKNDIDRPPQRLRCGIARGRVLKIGGDKDYVGPCINMAARLQKLGKFSFAFPRKGFDPIRIFDEVNHSTFVPKKVAIRGVGDGEIVMLLKSEFEALDPAEKSQYPDP